MGNLQSADAMARRTKHNPLHSALARVPVDVEVLNKNATMDRSDVSSLQFLLEHDNHAIRRKFEHVVMSNPAFHPQHNASLEEKRELCTLRFQAFCKSGILSVRDFARNKSNIFTCSEMAGMVCGALAVKMIAHFNLFGGTLFQSGSVQHKAMADQISTGEIVGCIGLTELGYGNNPVNMETTATFDPDTDEFVINSPSVLSQKYFCVGGREAHMCVVFAKMILFEKCEGVHAFLVPLRDENNHERFHKLIIDGHIKIEDLGVTIGPNGIDNVKLSFEGARIPRKNFLSGCCGVDRKGNYYNELKSLRQRFWQVSEQMLSSRLCLVSMLHGSCKMMLSSTINYGCTRKYQGPTGRTDPSIIENQIFQTSIFPLLATSYAMNFYLSYCKRRYSSRDDADHTEVAVLCNALKPQMAWFSERVSSVCRERVGGAGCLASSGFGEGIEKIVPCFECDSKVLQGRVAKDLLDLVETGHYTWKLSTSVTKPLDSVHVHLIDDLDSMFLFLSTVMELLEARFGMKVHDLSKKMVDARTRNDGMFEGKSIRERFYIAQMEVYFPEAQSVTTAFAEFQAFRKFFEVIQTKAKDPRLLGDCNNGTVTLHEETLFALMRLNVLYGITILQSDLAWFAGQKAITLTSIRQLQDLHSATCHAIRPDAMRLVEAFGVHPGINMHPVGKDWELWNASDHFGEVVVQNEKSVKQKVVVVEQSRLQKLAHSARSKLQMHQNFWKIVPLLTIFPLATVTFGIGILLAMKF
eukprot:gene634-229_t